MPYLHGEPEPGRRHPVKAVSRRSRAREQRELLPDGTGLAPNLYAGDDAGDTHSPVERCRRSPHHSFYAIGSRLALSLAAHNSGSNVAPYAPDCFLRDRHQPPLLGQA
jgi:hypothetical protein